MCHHKIVLRFLNPPRFSCAQISVATIREIIAFMKREKVRPAPATFPKEPYIYHICLYSSPETLKSEPGACSSPETLIPQPGAPRPDPQPSPHPLAGIASDQGRGEPTDEPCTLDTKPSTLTRPPSTPNPTS